MAFFHTENEIKQMSQSELRAYTNLLNMRKWVYKEDNMQAEIRAQLVLVTRVKKARGMPVETWDLELLDEANKQ